MPQPETFSERHHKGGLETEIERALRIKFGELTWLVQRMDEVHKLI